MCNGLCKTLVSPLHLQWRYFSFALNHQLSSLLWHHFLQIASSTADIVSGAYPMQSRPSYIRLSTFFTNKLGSLSFNPIYTVFGLNVHNNIAPKPVELEFWFCASNVF